MSPKGKYTSDVKSKTKRFGVQMSTLSLARGAVTQISIDISSVSIIAALRHAA